MEFWLNIVKESYLVKEFIDVVVSLKVCYFGSIVKDLVFVKHIVVKVSINIFFYQSKRLLKPPKIHDLWFGHDHFGEEIG